MLRLAAVLAVIACSNAKKPAPERLQAGDTAFVGATVVPMDRERTLTDHTVVVRGDRIIKVAPSATLDTKEATIVDARGKWLVPGLADMHVHTQSDRDFTLHLLNGVTTVRDMYGSPQHLTWRRAIDAGTLAGPTLITAGPIVDGKSPVWPGSVEVTSVDAAREAVREQKKAGYDFVKVYSKLAAADYEAIAAEAKAQGIAFAGHVPAAAGLEKVLASGQRSIEHLDGYIPFGGEPRVDGQIVAATVQAGIWNCPTLVVMERMGRLDNIAGLASTPGLEYVSPAMRDRWDPKNDFRLQSWTPAMFEKMRAKNELGRKLVADLAKAGAHLVLGTDTGNPYVIPGFAVHDELALLVRSGLTPWQALHMATAAPAEMVGQPGGFGVLAPGARADLLVVDRDPLRDIGALAKPALVFVRGKLHTREELLAIAGKAKAPADPFAALPELEVEGTKLAAARYEVRMNGSVIGHERALIAKLADGARVVRGQAVYDMPQAVFQYRSTADALEFADGLVITRDGKKVIAKPRDGKPVELATSADAVIAPQAVAEFVWYAVKLDKTRVGASTTLTAAEVMLETGVQLAPGTFTFKRAPDAEGRRIYAITGKHGELEVAGSLSVDPDGAPHEIEVKVRWGTFVTRRAD
jgi:imidazolonepropionase-like amidohydrolase